MAKPKPFGTPFVLAVALASELWLAHGGVAAATGSQAAQKVTVIDYPSPPSTLDEMWNRTPLVVRGKFTAVGLPVVATGEEAVHRAFDFQISEVLRDSENALKGRSVIRVVQYGGTAEVAGRLVRTASSMSRVFEIGDLGVLFLGRERPDGSFGVVFGDSSVLRLSATEAKFEVNLPPSLRRMAVFEGKPKIAQDKLLDLLRKLSSGR